MSVRLRTFLIMLCELKVFFYRCCSFCCSFFVIFLVAVQALAIERNGGQRAAPPLPTPPPPLPLCWHALSANLIVGRNNLDATLTQSTNRRATARKLKKKSYIFFLRCVCTARHCYVCMCVCVCGLTSVRALCVCECV